MQVRGRQMTKSEPPLYNRVSRPEMQIGQNFVYFPELHSFVCSITGGDRLLAVFRRAFSLPPALRPRPGPVRFPSNPGACTVYL